MTLMKEKCKVFKINNWNPQSHSSQEIRKTSNSGSTVRFLRWFKLEYLSWFHRNQILGLYWTICGSGKPGHGGLGMTVCELDMNVVDWTARTNRDRDCTSWTGRLALVNGLGRNCGRNPEEARCDLRRGRQKKRSEWWMIDCWFSCL